MSELQKPAGKRIPPIPSGRQTARRLPASRRFEVVAEAYDFLPAPLASQGEFAQRPIEGLFADPLKEMFHLTEKKEGDYPLDIRTVK